MKIRIFLTMLILGTLVACSAKSPVNTGDLAKTVTVLPNKSAVVGQIISSTDNKPLANTSIRLCQVFWDAEHKNATFVLEGATSPGAITLDDGTFIINDVTPREYVILIGDVTEKYDIIKENPDTAKIFNLSQGQVVDLGVLEANLNGQ